MGRRGPAPTPTKVKMVRGETRPGRLTLHEPLPSPDVPEIPADMDAEAKIVVHSLTVGYVWHAGVNAGEVAGGLTRIGFEIAASRHVQAGQARRDMLSAQVAVRSDG